MSKILTNKESLLKNGYCIVRNLLNNKEVEKAKSIINKISKTSGKKLNTNMFNYRESWELFTNDRLLNIVKDLLGPDIFFFTYLSY